MTELTVWQRDLKQEGHRRKEDSFIAKKYSKTPWHLVELITSIDEDGYIKTQKVRYGEEEE